MEALREFRGYLNGELLYTFPLQWLDSIEVSGGVVIVQYYDEMRYDPATGAPLMRVRVDKIDIK